MAHVNSRSFQSPDGIFLYQTDDQGNPVRRIGGPYPSNEVADNASRLASQMVGEAPIEHYIEFLKSPITSTRFEGKPNPWGDLPTRQEQADFRGRGIPSGRLGNISANVKGDIKDLGGFLKEGVEGIPDISKKFQGFLSRVSDSPIADYASSIFQARTEAGVGADVGPTALYNAISSAEFRGTDPSFIRTRHSEAEGGSTAYGPVQITSTLMGEKRGELNLTSDEDKYVDRFLEQGRRFNKYGNEPDLPGYDPKYDYGGEGDLTSEQDQELYRSVAEKLINLMWREKDEDIESFLERWRGVPRQQDEDYYKAFDKSL